MMINILHDEFVNVQECWFLLSEAQGQTRSVTFLLQSELPLGLNVLKGCSQVPGQTASAVGHQ